jgi:hypothetical protein
LALALEGFAVNPTVPVNTKARRRWINVSPGQAVLVLVIVGVAVYTAVTLIRGIKTEQRIDSAHVALIVLALAAAGLLWQPGLLERISELKIGGVSLTLQKVERKLEDISLVVNLLLPEAEQGHLLRLNYRVYAYSDRLYKELIHLRKSRLISMCRDAAERDGRKHLSQLPRDKPFDLTEFVKLTKAGKGWADRLKEIDDREPAPHP